MTRSPKMNEITPPKLMPPDQSRVASGMLPIEQVNDATAISTTHEGVFDQAPRLRKIRNEKNLPPFLRHDGHEQAGNQHTNQDFLPHHRDVHEKGVRHGDPRFVFFVGRVSVVVMRLMPVAVTAAIVARFAFVLLHFPQKSARQRKSHQYPHDSDQDERTDHLRQNKMPTQENPQNQAQLQYQVCRGKHERQRRDEMRALLQDRVRSGRGGIRAR